jgi:hypothetical protein
VTGNTEAGNIVAAYYFNQAMENSVSGQTLAAGGSLAEAKAAAGILAATASAELSVFGGEGLLAAYGNGAFGSGSLGTANYLLASSMMNAGIGAGTNIATQELSTGSINAEELGFSAGLGFLCGYGSGLSGLVRENALQTAEYFMGKYGSDLDVSGWQTLNAVAGYTDGVGGSAFEFLLHETLTESQSENLSDPASGQPMGGNKISKEGGI